MTQQSSPKPADDAGRPTGPPRPRLRLRQDRPRRAGPRPARRRRRPRLDRRVRGQAHRVARHAGDRGRGPHRLPRVPRGPGQDAAPARARRHPRRHPQGRPRRAARRPRRRAVRARRRQPLPVPRDRRLGGRAPTRCVEQIDIGGPSMVRAAAKNHPSVAVVTDPAAYGARAGCRARPAASRWASASRWRRRRSCTPPTYDNAVANWMGNAYTDTSDGTGFPAWTGATFDRAAVLRYGENPHQQAALYTPLASGRRVGASSCTARRCRTTTTSTPTPPCAPRTTTATSRPWRSSSTPTRAASPSARHRRGRVCRGPRDRPGVGLRRHHRHQPPGDRRDGAAASSDIFTEVDRRARLRRRRARGAARRRRTSACCACPPSSAAAPTRSRRGRSAAACSCRPSTRSTPSSRRGRRRDRRRRRRELAARRRGRRPTRRRSPTCSSPGARCAR